MKNLIPVLALLLCSVTSAQTFKYGITGNFHRGSIAGVHDYSTGKYGGGLGFFAQWSLVENDVFDSAWLYITPQIEYNMQGENAKAERDVYGLQKYHHDYVAMQVYLKWFFHQGNMKRDVFLFAGPRIEYMVRQDVNVDPAYDAAYYQYNLDDEVKKFGYGVSMGIGLKINLHLEGFLRFDRGFSTVYTNNTNNNTYNRMIALGFNYYIDENWW